jgi:hypothetical protein|tara:strand:- start:58 stop:342 length:285 start_codon:yes stop_codon:yes gene_type:complete
MKLEDINMVKTKFPNGVQAILKFGPHYEISIIQNEMSYGGKTGLYEIAVYLDNEMTALPGITEPGDTVKGFLTEDNVNDIIHSMTQLTKREPQQ